MKILVAVLCLTALSGLQGVSSHGRTRRSVNAEQFPHRDRVPLGRFVSPDDIRQRSLRVPRGPPFRITNAHTGIEEDPHSATRNVIPSVSRNKNSTSRSVIRSASRNKNSTSRFGTPSASRSPDSASRTDPPSASSDSARPLQRRVRRVRKRRPESRRPASRHLSQIAKPNNHRFARKIVEGTLQNVRSGARLIGASGNYGYVPLVSKLIDNATLIRPNLVEGFSCEGRTYGYYADQLNDCQVFHICVPMKQIFPDHFTEKDVYHFSFICPEFTIFSQDAMVCAWSQYAVPCEDAHNLYYMNQNFFVVSNDDVQKETATGYGQPVGGTRPPPVPSAAGTYPVATGGVSSAATAARPPPPTYPTPGISQPTPPPPPPPAAYPAQARPQVQPRPQTPPPPPAYPTPGISQPTPPPPPPPAAYPEPARPQVQPRPQTPPPPPAYPTPGISQPTPPPPPPPSAYPAPARPQVQPQPQTPSSIVGYPSQRSETIETLPDTTQPEPPTTTS